MRTFLIVIFGMTISFVAFNQQYNVALGIKGGYHYNGGASLSLKHFVRSNGAFEWNFGGGKNDLWLQGLFEMNYPLSKGVEWYWGAGADFGRDHGRGAGGPAYPVVGQFHGAAKLGNEKVPLPLGRGADAGLYPDLSADRGRVSPGHPQPRHLFAAAL